MRTVAGDRRSRMRRDGARSARTSRTLSTAPSRAWSSRAVGREARLEPAISCVETPSAIARFASHRRRDVDQALRSAQRRVELAQRVDEGRIAGEARSEERREPRRQTRPMDGASKPAAAPDAAPGSAAPTQRDTSRRRGRARGG